MKQIEIVARSTEQAKAKASDKLGVPIEDLHVIEEYEPDDQDLKDLAEEEQELAESEKQGEVVLYVLRVSLKRSIAAVQEWVDGLLERFQPGSTCEVVAEDNRLRVIIDADDPSIFIGKQGHTLAALQHIVTRVGPGLVPDCPQLFLDVGDYRDRKAEQLERIVRQAVQRATRTRQTVALRPMPSTDRKYIHNMLKNREGITTSSHGTEPKRYVVIEPSGGARGGKRRGGGGRNRDNGRSRNGNQADVQPPLPPGVDPQDLTAGGLKELRRREELLRRQSSPLVNVNKRQNDDLQIEEHGTKLPAWQQNEDDPNPGNSADGLVDELE